MRKLILAAMLLLSVGAYAQPNFYQAPKIIALKDITLRGYRIDSISNDTNFTSNSVNIVPTQFAVKRLLANNAFNSVLWGNVTGKVTANGTTDGILSSSDWNGFNGKQSALNGTGLVAMNGTTVSYLSNLDSTRISALRSENYYNTKYLRLTSNYIDSIRLANTGILHNTPTFSIVGKTAVITQTLANQTANTFFAAPNGSTGTPTFRSIVAADVPTLNQNTTGSAGSVANTLTISGELSSIGSTSYNGSTNRVLAIQNASITNSMLAGSIASAKLVGTDINTVGTITSGTWNGTTIAIANGGTGSTTQNFVDLSNTQSSIGGAKTWTGSHSFTSASGHRFGTTGAIGGTVPLISAITTGSTKGFWASSGTANNATNSMFGGAGFYYDYNNGVNINYNNFGTSPTLTNGNYFSYGSYGNGGYYSQPSLATTGTNSINSYGFTNFQYFQSVGGTLTANGTYNGFRSAMQLSGGGGLITVSSYSDLYLDNVALSAGTGIVTNRYGLNIAYDATNVTNAWGIYQSNSAIKNYLNGNTLIGTTTDAGYKLDVNGTARASKFQLSALNTAPSSASDTGTTGEIRIVNGYIYVCVATNTWQRSTLSTF